MSLTEKIESALSSKLFCVIVIAVVAMLVYANTLSNEFVYDDNHQVLKNKWLGSLGSIPEILTSSAWGFQKDLQASNYYRPVMHLVYLFNAQIFGIEAWGFHLVNVVFHALNAVALFFTALHFAPLLLPGMAKENKAAMFALGAALLFAVHPINTEAVTWVAGIPELSFTLFSLISLNLYLRRGDDAVLSPRYLGSVGFFFLATLSKETAFTLPLILAAHDVIIKKDLGIRTPLLWMKRFLPFAVAGAAYLALRLSALKGVAPRAAWHADLSLFERLLNVFPLVGKYFLKLVLPLNLNAFHVLHPVRTPVDITFIASFIFTAVLLYAIWRLRGKLPALSFLLAWMALPLLPVLYVPVLGENSFTERYLYLSSIGFTMFVSALAFKARERYLIKSALPALMIILVLVVAAIPATIMRNRVWKDDVALWVDTLGKSPDSGLAHYSLGFAYYERKRVPEAIEKYRDALKIVYTAPFWHYDLGLAYHDLGMLDDAIFHYNEALRFGFQNDADTHNNLGNAYAVKGMLNDAAEEYKKAIGIDPDNSLANRNLAIVLRRLGHDVEKQQ
jgi:hypothetical protein